MAETTGSGTQRTNWAGNLTYGAESFVEPKSLAEAQEIVHGARTLKVVGSRHCFNDIADTTGTQLSLAKLNRLVSVDREAGRVTIEAGLRYDALGELLEAQGLALHNLASLPHITVAGAVATATHGSGSAHGSLATAVTAVEFIDCTGDLVTLERGRDEGFLGAVVNLGAVGVVSKLTLKVEPTYKVRQTVYRDMPLATVEARFEEIMAGGYSVSMFTDWQGAAIDQVWVKEKVAPGETAEPSPTYFGARQADRNMHPVAALDAVNCSKQMGVPGAWFERLPHFRPGFTPASGDELQVEYFVPLKHAVSAIKTLHRLGNRLAGILVVSEIRTVDADDLWMSPFHEPSACFHFSCKQNWPELKKVLPVIETALAPFSPRPHWGKLFTLAPETIQARYDRLDDFRDLLATHDPKRKLRNAYIERCLFGG